MNEINDKPVASWALHARRRHLWLCKLRAYISMAGIRDRVMLDNIMPGSKILDVGCGGGRPILTCLGDVTGLEPVRYLADQARSVYKKVTCCQAQWMPFGDRQFDAVVSTDIFGHIPTNAKDDVINEMFRVLKPGGITLHVAEIDSTGWMARIAKREPEPYHENWIEAPDHRYLESADDLIERFDEAGFTIQSLSPVQGIIPVVGALTAGFKDHRKLPPWLAMAVIIDSWFTSEVAKEIGDILITPVALFNRFALIDWGNMIIIKAIK